MPRARDRHCAAVLTTIDKRKARHAVVRIPQCLAQLGSCTTMEEGSWAMTGPSQMVVWVASCRLRLRVRAGDCPTSIRALAPRNLREEA